MEWVILGVLLATLAAAIFLAPKPKIENARAATLGDFRFPRAKEGDPVPIIWGTVRLRSPNTIWYGDLQVKAITEKVKTGLFSSKRITKGYKYYLGMDLALCLGPQVRLLRIWAGKELAWSGNAMNDGLILVDKPELFGGDQQRGGLQGNAFFYTGAFDQSPNAYLIAKIDPDMPAYGGVSHIVFESFYMGTTPSLEPFNFELQRLDNAVAAGKGIISTPYGADANPMEVAYDALTAKWGRLGIDPVNIDLPSWQAAATTLFNELNGMSIIVASSNTGKDIAEEALRQADGLLYQDPSTGKIKAKLIRDDYNVATLPVLDQSIVKDLRNFSKTTWDGTFNQVRVTFVDRARDYADSVAVAQDMGNLNLQGRMKSSASSMPGCTNADLANRLAARALSVLSVPLYRCELVCNRKASAYRPGDVFKLNWTPYGITGMVMRVQNIDYGSAANGDVTIVAIQDRFASALATFAPPDSGTWTRPTTMPADVANRKVFEPPYYFLKAAGIAPLANESTLYVVAKGPTTISSDFNVIVSADNWATYGTVIEASPYPGTARLTAALTALDGSAEGILPTVAIDTLDNPSVLVNHGTLAEIRDGHTLFMIDDEIMMYTSFVVAGAGYTLGTVYRGLFDTAMSAHAVGATVFFISGQDGLFGQMFGSTATVKSKILDKTPLGTLSPTQATEITTVMDRRLERPVPPDYLTIAGSRSPTEPVPSGSIPIAWRHRTRQSSDVRVYNDVADALEAGQDYRLRHRINGGTWIESFLTAATANLQVDITSSLEVEVFSRLGGLFSRVGESKIVQIQGYLTFGRTTVGGLTASYAAGGKSVSRFNLADTGDVARLRAYISGVSATGKIRGVIYAESGSNTPGALIAVTNEVIGYPSGAWVDLIFPALVRLTPGDYYLGVINDTATQTSGLANTGVNFFNTDTYSDGPTDPFGVGTASTTLKPIYAIYTLPYVTLLGTGDASAGTWGGSSWSANYSAGNKYTVLSACEVFRAELTVNADHATAKTKILIWADDGTGLNPGLLKYASTEKIGLTTGVNQYLFPAGSTLTPGTYWIGLITDTSIAVGVTAVAGTAPFDADTYTDGPAATFTADGSQPYTICVRALGL